MMKRTALQLAISVGIVALPGMANASSTPMTNPVSGVVVGYWHNWCDGAGYKGGNAPCVTLDAVNPMYNIVNVSFMKVYDVAEGRIPTFKLDPTIGLSEQQFINQISELNQQGRSVLIALGGADAHIELKTGDETAFAEEIIRLTEKYGFDGLDIDLEQAAVTAADNQTVIPAALRLVKDHYREQGKNFLITMAPEFPYLTAGGKYVPYIDNLEGYYDWINPQFYNQGGDGIWVEGVGWIAQNNDELKEEFIYYISDSLSNGTRGFHKIPHNKLVFGIPSNIDAAATGYVQEPQDLYSAFEQLSEQGQPLRGVMTWSVNWDMGTNAQGQEYKETFINDYGPFIHGQVTPPPGNDGEPILKGVENTRVLHRSAFDELEGVSAHDKEDGDLTSSIVVEGYVDTASIGTYVLTYKVSDSDDNQTTQARSVEVYSQKPVLSGVENTTVMLGGDFDSLEGVTANDAEDGDLTSSIQVTGQVDVNTIGTYSLVYKVSDSAAQTVEATRAVTVTDGATCANPWDANSVYVEGDKVSHDGHTWKAGWWTRGEEPGTTGEWGVWSKDSDASCGGETPDPDVDPTLGVTGLASSYALDNGQVTLNLQLMSNQALTVDVSVRNASNQVVEQSQSQVNGQSALTIELQGVEAGTYQLLLEGVAEDGETVSSQNGFVVTDETTPPPGEYPDYVAGTVYQAGDRVIGADNGVYECKPWPYTAWCASASYAPGDSLYWDDAWIKL